MGGARIRKLIVRAVRSSGRRRPATAERGLAIERLLRRGARRLGWHLVRADYYSPVLDVELVPDSVFSRPAPMPGLPLRLEAQLDRLERTVRPYLDEWDPPTGPPGDGLGFYLHNPFYGPLDSHLLYAFVRRLRPRRVVEIGSGFSTLVIRQAAAVNASQGQDAEHVVVDPHPSYLMDRLRQSVRLITRAPNEVPISLFTRLQAGDILFVDSTHVVKAGGDVPYLVLEVLPILAPGVVVHFHDIFRPFEYPRALYERFNKHWQEHHLLEAFLSFNEEYEVLSANHALARLHRGRLAMLIPSLAMHVEPSGFWIEKVARTRR